MVVEGGNCSLPKAISCQSFESLILAESYPRLPRSFPDTGEVRVFSNSGRSFKMKN